MRSGGVAGAKGGCGKTESRRAKRKFLSLKAFFVMHCNLRVIFKALGKRGNASATTAAIIIATATAKAAPATTKATAAALRQKSHLF